MLFTGWCISQFKNNFLLKLPSSLEYLIDENGQHEANIETDLPLKIETAASLIWNDLGPAVRAMLLFFHARPGEHNSIIHTPPSMNEAISLILAGGIPEAEQELAQIIVHMGVKRSGDQTWQPLFDGATAMNSNTFDVLVRQWNGKWKMLSD